MQRSAAKLGERPPNETSASLPEGSGAAATQCHWFLWAPAVLGSGHAGLWPHRAPAVPGSPRHLSQSKLGTALLAHANQEKERLQHPRDNKRGKRSLGFLHSVRSFRCFFLVLPVNPSAPIPVSFATAETSMLGNAAGGERWRNDS